MTHFYLSPLLLKQFKMVRNLSLVLVNLAKSLAPEHETELQLLSTAVKPLIPQVLHESRNQKRGELHKNVENMAKE